ncbi:MAG: zf-TFIIB domain-containing protein [Acidimicrobiales bacterium]|nr:zf-TFIIB domain-containing protein [Acidimicrobiales bacterium]
MKCPVCPDEALSISSREGVEIDFCPQCRGVWLDRGELDKIIERAQPGAAPEPPRREETRSDDRDDRRYGDERRDYDVRYDKRKKKRSFLEDIFDFD